MLWKEKKKKKKTDVCWTVWKHRNLQNKLFFYVGQIACIFVKLWLKQHNHVWQQVEMKEFFLGQGHILFQIFHFLLEPFALISGLFGLLGLASVINLLTLIPEDSCFPAGHIALYIYNLYSFPSYIRDSLHSLLNLFFQLNPKCRRKSTELIILSVICFQKK